MLPNFVVIGAAKTGTTSLHAYLDAHPEVFVSATKELNYFVAELNWDRGRAWYETQFDAAGDARAVGEVSPLYTARQWYGGVPQRMADVVPDAKLVYVVRHPLERMRSHYLEHLGLGIESSRPTRAFETDRGYLDSSRYAFQLDAYLQCFAREQILVIRSEDLRHRRAETLAHVFAFLGVDPRPPPSGTEGERYRSEAKALRHPLVHALKRRSWFRVARRAVPAPARRAFGRATTLPRGDASSVSIAPALEGELLDELRADLARLRLLVGPHFDLWGLA